MRKKNLLLGLVLIVMLGSVGCGQKETSVTRVEAEKAYEMKADAPQTETDETVVEQDVVPNVLGMTETEAQKAAEQAGMEAKKTAEQAGMEAKASDEVENLITEEEALEIVLNKVPGATKSNVKIQLDYDDGYWKYEGEIIYNLKEYEFELNAENGTILEWSVESVYD